MMRSMSGFTGTCAIWGKLPVYVDGCYTLTRPEKMKEAVEELKRYQREFDTEHLKVHTLKIFMDGTLKIQTAALITPYEDTGAVGATTFEKEGIAELLKLLNEAGLDLHLHTVGERASHIILDGVEMAKKELGDDFRVKVTCAHLEIQDDTDLKRFAELGAIRPGGMPEIWAVNQLRHGASFLGRNERFPCTGVSRSWIAALL